MTLLALAMAPGLAIMIYIYWKDQFDREPRRLLIWAFFLGVLSVIPVFIIGNGFSAAGAGISKTEPWKTAFYAFIAVALTEEASKFFFVRRFLFTHKEFDEPFDGITYAVMVSMGFATLENILYVMQGGMQVALMRMVTAVPAHATFGVLMGYFMGLAKFKKNGFFLNSAGLLAAMVFHGAYDFFLMQENIPLQGTGAITSLLIGLYLSKQAIRIHNENSPFKWQFRPFDFKHRKKG